MNHLILMMGGKGARFGADIPKQYVLVDEKPLFSYILEKIAKCTILDSIVIVSHVDWIDYVQEWCDICLAEKECHIITGGNNRSESVKNGLMCLKSYASSNDVVMIHDATHPYIDEIGMTQIIEAVNQYGAATLGSRSYDTVYRVDKNDFIVAVEPREMIYAGASPEAFRFGDILDIYMNASYETLEKMTSAGAIALASGIPMKMIEAHVTNIKITFSKDLILFRRLNEL